MFNITGGTFISLDPQNPIGLLPIDILTPVQMTTSGPTAKLAIAPCKSAVEARPDIGKTRANRRE